MELKSESIYLKTPKTSIGFKIIEAVYNNSIISFAMLTRTQKLLRIFRAVYAKR